MDGVGGSVVGEAGRAQMAYNKEGGVESKISKPHSRGVRHQVKIEFHIGRLKKGESGGLMVGKRGGGCTIWPNNRRRQVYLD